MRVMMLRQITGSRDGERWPAPGATIDVPDDEAAALIAAGHAEQTAPPARQEKATATPRGEKR